MTPVARRSLCKTKNNDEKSMKIGYLGYNNRMKQQFVPFDIARSSGSADGCCCCCGVSDGCAVLSRFRCPSRSSASGRMFSSSSERGLTVLGLLVDAAASSSKMVKGRRATLAPAGWTPLAVRDDLLAARTVPCPDGASRLDGWAFPTSWSV